MESADSEYEGESRGFQKLGTDSNGPLSSAEKSNKRRLVIKDGKIIGMSKGTIKKDKGNYSIEFGN